MGHRGTRGLAPENTLVSFQIANRFTPYFELDTMLCGSGELVVIHDETVDRTTNGKGRVSDLSLEEIQSLDAGAFFSEEFVGESIPSLRELFEKMPSNCIFDIEVKSEGEEKERIRLAEALIPLLKELKIENRVFISSFDSFLLGKVKEKNPSLLRGQLLDSVWKEEDWKVSEPDLILPNHRSVTKEWISQLHKEGYLVIPYTANEEADWIRLKEAGVDGIITDRPDLLLSYLEK
ncbi:glycerophosphodiester phosphodiesterase [Leptospira idonii]|uniref:Glycerophosphodiester phosphodiesterase n=2 Tax=Leptospira idonii TaxID=1193500 RepID=A0A4V6QMW3_9LEPT|nr:glycerophosphodiester phosphodiesterase [Leptospira idonii]